MTQQEELDIAAIKQAFYDHLWDNPFALLPAERRTMEVSRIAVEKWPFNLEFVPNGYMTPELCRDAVVRRGETLQFVPEPMKTPELCRAAVRSNGYALYYVPIALRTEELCTEAVRRQGWALEFVPEGVKTPEMCRMALSRLQSADCEILRHIPFSEVCLEGFRKFCGTLDRDYEIFSAIPPQLITAEIAEYGVRMDARCLTLVPKELRTEELCLEAVSKNGLLLGEVPEEIRTAKLCEAAVSENYLAMDFVPQEQRTPELFEKAVYNNSLAIKYLLPEQLTHEVCSRAIGRTDDLRVLYYIPYADIHERTLDMRCTDYMETYEFIKSMNPGFMTPKLAEKIFLREPELFMFLPDHCKDKELCKTAIQYNGAMLNFVPAKFKTPELFLEAIRHSPYAIRYIPEDMKTPELYMQLVQENPRNLVGIPRMDRTYELCKVAFDNTYGKDKSDFSIIGALTDPSLVLQVFREQDDPKKISFLMDVLHMNSRLITEDVALEAVRKNGSVLRSVPPSSITPQVAEAAVFNTPSALQWVPAANRTPKMYLYAEKCNVEPPITVPEEIKKANNIYAFAKQVEKRLNKELTHAEHLRLYAGLRVRLENVKFGGRTFENVELRYNPKNGKLNLRQLMPGQGDFDYLLIGKEYPQKPKQRSKGPKI